MNEPTSNDDMNAEATDGATPSSGAIPRGLGVLALCIVVTFLFFATGLNQVVSLSGHPHGLPAALFVGWLIAWGIGWGLMRLQVLATANGEVRRGLAWSVWSLGVLTLILISGF